MGCSRAGIAYGPGVAGSEPPVLGSILTRQYRFATRGIEIGVQTAHQAVGVAGDVVGAVTGRLGLGDGNGNGNINSNGGSHGEPEAFTGVMVPEAEPRLEPLEPRPESLEPRPEAPQPRRAPPPPAPPAAPPPAPEPAHVSSEPELVRESAEPGAEDGAGAQVRVGEPWPAYRNLKARDVVARLPFATREELAAVELFELAHANRKSVVVAAQRALKKASPPR